MVSSGVSGERGQASVELIAVIPAVAALLVLALQIAVVGWALWSAEGAARAGARAAVVGGDVDRAARSGLPDSLRGGARISVKNGVRVELTAPAVAPGLPAVHVAAGGRLPGDDDAP
jgi:pilus assembly protein CpaE